MTEVSINILGSVLKLIGEPKMAEGEGGHNPLALSPSFYCNFFKVQCTCLDYDRYYPKSPEVHPTRFYTTWMYHELALA